MRICTIATYFFSLIAILIACNSDTDRNGRPIPNVSNIKINLQLDRFDEDLWSIDTNQLADGVSFLEKKYPDFAPLLFNRILKNPQNPKETSAEILGSLIRPLEMRGLKDSVNRVFGDFSSEKKELARLCQFYKFYFPNKPVPRFLAVNTGYGYGVFPVSDSLFCFSTEFFLGENHPAYREMLDLPEYIRERMDKKYLAAQVAESFATDLAGPPTGRRLLDEMFANGKAYFVKECLIPESPDSIKWGFTQKQVEWALQNELEIWSYLLQEKLLYSTDREKFKKLTGESPNAGDSPPALREAPGRVANWLGYRIVCAWMRRHPQASLDELLVQNDPQKFLEAAKYKPKKQ